MSKSKTETVSNTIKNPDNWKTGDEPMTGAQSSYLHTLADQADAPDEAERDLTKAEASKRIDDLREKVGLANDGNSASDH
jgi:hypothetical protein